MNKVTICLIAHDEYFFTTYQLENLGFKVCPKEEEALTNEIKYVNQVYDVEVELLVALKISFKTDNRFYDYFKSVLKADYFVETSGISMQPLIKEGDLVGLNYFEEGNELKVGDVIDFDFNGQRILHRVINIQSDCVITQGDNNFNLDPNKYYHEEVVTYSNINGIMVGIKR